MYLIARSSPPGGDDPSLLQPGGSRRGRPAFCWPLDRARMGRSALSLMASLSCVCVLGAAHASLASGRDWLSRRHSAPGGERFHHNRRNRSTALSAVRRIDGGVAQQPSLRQIDGFGNSWRRRVCRRRHVVRRVVLQACGHSVTLGRQRELVVISARHPTVFATPARQTRIELRLQWFIR
jgi:hypothetical protein